MASYKTILNSSLIELPKVKGSRFIAVARQVETEQQIEAVLAELKARWPNASHHCYAWRLTQDAFRIWDDGEPARSAGPPILQQIDGLDLEQTLVVVLRWFGGTKLGIGGLIRAYGGSAKAALNEAGIDERIARRGLLIRLPYNRQGGVQSVLRQFDVEMGHCDFEAEVHMTLWVNSDHAEALRDALIERSAAEVHCEWIEAR